MPSRRRGPGEGSITQLPDGRWMARADFGYLDGKRQRRAVFGRTRQEAARKLNVLLQEKAKGLPAVPERQPLGPFLERWLGESVKPSVRPSTYACYASYVRGHLIPGLGRTNLTKLAPSDVQSFLNRKLRGGLSPRTVQLLRAILRRALGQALKWGMVGRNVAALVDPPKLTAQEIQPLTPEEVRGLLAGIRGDRHEALYITAIATGLRQGESLGLKWSDVDLDRGEIVVRHALQRIDGRPTLVEPKTHRSRRTVGLPTLATEALRAQRVRQLEERLKAGVFWNEEDYVFATQTGLPLHPSNVTHGFQKTLGRLGLRRQRFHDLRHCCASLMLSQGLTLKDVMETLGHSQISLTANTYAHLYPERRREVADRMDAVLGKGAV